MKIDYRKRCLIPGEHYDTMIYGMTASASPRPSEARDIVTDYGRLSRGGRRPGHTMQRTSTAHFFTKRMS